VYRYAPSQSIRYQETRLQGPSNQTPILCPIASLPNPAQKANQISVTTSSEGFSNIDWKDVKAVRALNKALLKEDWNLDVEMKDDRLCPPVCLLLDAFLTVDT
jgi:hypothetical protein